MQLENNIYSEMLTHVAVCTHKKPQSILLIGTKDSGCVGELSKYDDLKITITEHIETLDENSHDIVIIDLETTNDSEFYSQVDRVLKDDGIMVTHGGNYFENLDEHKEILDKASQNFIISMPYHVRNKTFILSSKMYHPTADVILQRADLLEDVKFYNSDMQIASFVKPTYIFKELLGISKN